MRHLVLALFASLAVSPLPAQAAITVVAQYRFGEADPAAAPGAPGANPTVDSAGTNALSRVGSPVYAGDGRPRPASTLSMALNGSTDRYIGAVTTPVTNNMGVEAWVRSNGSTVANATIAYNGNTASSGFGLFRLGNQWGFLYGGVTLNGSAPVTTDWTHLALVRDNGLTTFYVNGQARATSAAAPLAAAGNFLVGGNPLVATEFFDGLIDEVRVFTFQPGQFVVGDLNLGSGVEATAVPSTSPLSLAALAALVGLLGLGVVGRFRR